MAKAGLEFTMFLSYQPQPPESRDYRCELLQLCSRTLFVLFYPELGIDLRASLQAAGQVQRPHPSFLSVTESYSSVDRPHFTGLWTSIWADSVVFTGG